MPSMFALIDCNNFYASCERIFRPDLWNKPVLVLSSNDGCVISRSQEVKDLGIPMGIPFFKIKNLTKFHNVEVFSSNFSLYADISRRFFEIISSFSQNTEIYSIDELFLELFESNEDFEHLGNLMRKTVLKTLGLPISIGFSSTKTLSKVANYLAKKETSKGVRVLFKESEIWDALKGLPLEKVWGIGKRLSSKLNSLDIKSALDLAQTNPKHMRRFHSIILEKTVRELRGEPCISFERFPAPSKSIQVSRSFGSPLTSLEDIQGAMSCFCEHAAQKLRFKNLHAHGAYVYLGSHSGRQKTLSYSSTFIEFPTGAQDPCSIVNAALKTLKSTFKRGLSYSKAGILLVELKKSTEQLSLWGAVSSSNAARSSLFKAVDKIQTKFGGDAIKLASSLSYSWRPKFQKLSPLYTLKWADLPIVKAI